MSSYYTWVAAFLIAAVAIMVAMLRQQRSWDTEEDQSRMRSLCDQYAKIPIPAATGDGYSPFVMASIYAHCFFSDNYTVGPLLLLLHNYTCTDATSPPCPCLSFICKAESFLFMNHCRKPRTVSALYPNPLPRNRLVYLFSRILLRISLLSKDNRIDFSYISAVYME